MSNKDAFLKGLANISHPKSDKILKNSIEKLRKILIESNDYYEIEDSISKLSDISIGVHKESYDIIIALLDRLGKEQFSFKEDDSLPKLVYEKYHNKESMICKVIGALGRIRYYETESVLDALLEYSIYPESDVSGKAIEVLSELSEYKIDVLDAIGMAPQNIIIEKFESLSNDLQIKYFNAILSVCSNMLSPTMTGSSSDYKTFTWRSGELPVSKEIKDLRNRILEFLENLYNEANFDIDNKIAIISTMHSATSVHHKNYSDESFEMIVDNTKKILSFYEQIVENEKLQIVQKVEHELYWTWYHKNNVEEIVEHCERIRDTIASLDEYKIYKVLIGSSSDSLREWDVEKKADSAEYFRKKQEEREGEIRGYVDEINSDSFNEWETRILSFIASESSESNDFGYLHYFFRQFFEKSPDLGLKFLNNNLEKIDEFLLSILIGLLEGKREVAIQRINKWVDDKMYLKKIATVFEYDKHFDKDLLKSVLNQAESINDLDTQIQVMSSISANYDNSEDKTFLIDELFIPVIDNFIKNSDARWILSFWHRRGKAGIFKDLEDNGVDKVLKSMLHLEKIDYHAEGILTYIAKKYPEKVIEYFGKRLKIEDENGEKISSHDAIPYSFHELHKDLSKDPKLAISIVKDWFNEKDSLSIYKGPRLLKLIFFNFPDEFKQELVSLVQTKDKVNIDFVIAILRNYEGEVLLHDVCRELIINMPDTKEYNGLVNIILQSTGVLSGEYGFAKAYEKKIEQIEYWLKDDNDKVKKFAEEYTSYLNERVEHEYKKADDEIELRKFKYGDNSNEEEKSS